VLVNQSYLLTDIQHFEEQRAANDDHDRAIVPGSNFDGTVA
jgi:hypothetical protein